MKLLRAGVDLRLLHDFDKASARIPGVSNWAATESDSSTLALAFCSTVLWEGLPGSQLNVDDDTTSLVKGTAFFAFEVLVSVPSSARESNSATSALVTISMSRWEAFTIHAGRPGKSLLRFPCLAGSSLAVSECWKRQGAKACSLNTLRLLEGIDSVRFDLATFAVNASEFELVTFFITATFEFELGTFCFRTLTAAVSNWGPSTA